MTNRRHSESASQRFLRLQKSTYHFTSCSVALFFPSNLCWAHQCIHVGRKRVTAEKVLVNNSKTLRHSWSLALLAEKSEASTLLLFDK